VLMKHERPRQAARDKGIYFSKCADADEKKKKGSGPRGEEETKKKRISE